MVSITLWVGVFVDVGFHTILLIGLLLLACITTTAILAVLLAVKALVSPSSVFYPNRPAVRLLYSGGAIAGIACGLLAWLLWVSIIAVLSSHGAGVGSVVVDHAESLALITVINTAPIVAGIAVIRTIHDFDIDTKPESVQ